MKQTPNQEKGITLIALVVTIIVLMILAAVGIATLTGDNGILTRAQEAKDITKKVEIEEQLRLAQLSAKIKKEGGDITIGEYLQELTEEKVDFAEGDTSKYGDLYEIYQKVIVVEGKYIYGLSEKNGDVVFEEKGTENKIKPTVKSIEIVERTETTEKTTIKVKVSTVRNNGGTLKYYIKEENAVDYAFIEEQEGEVFTFDNLNPNKTYSKIKVEAIAPNGETAYLEIEISNVPSLEGVVTLSYRTSSGQVIREKDWTKGPVMVTVEVNTQGYTLQTAKRVAGEEIIWQETATQKFTTNGTIYARLFDTKTNKAGKVYTKEISNIDAIDPTIEGNTIQTSATTNSIELKIKVTDSKSGLSKIKWFYRKSTDDKDTNVEDVYQAMNGTIAGETTQQEKTKTLSGLIANVTYHIYAEIYDVAGNMTRVPPTGTITQATGTVPGGKENIGMGGLTESAAIGINYEYTNWTNINVDVTLTNKTGKDAYKLQYKKDDEEWIDYTGKITFEKNGTIIARLTDNQTAGQTGNVGAIATGNVMKIDKTAPTISTETPLTAASVSTNSIGLNIKVTDGDSGLSKIKWFYKKSTEANYTSTEDVYQSMNGATAGDRTEQEKTKTLSNLTSGMTYHIYVEIYDVAGNKTTSDVITEKTLYEANEPNLMNGMTAIYWDASNKEKTLTAENTAEEWNQWYEYEEGDNQTDTKTSRWANAKTSDGSYWVWIPRYEYKIISGEGTSTAGKIEVKFIPTSQTTADEGYKIHPAFQDGTSNHFKRGEWDKELSGIWVAKYETSHSDATESSAGSSSTLKVVPNVPSWRSITIGDSYTTAYNYDRSKESHMMKNSEWGAVAYLTHSQYGRNGHEIDINNSSSFITGNGGGSTNASEASGVTNAYNTTKGAGASTTGNIYGIYDLSGGAWERVAAYITNGNSSLNNGQSFAYQTADPEGYQTRSTKYATVYPYDSSNDTYTNNYATYKNAGYGYGDAILETSARGSGTTSWFGDYSFFPHTGTLFFLRGGGYGYGSSAGAFCFNVHNGNADGFDSFRVVLARCLAL